MGRGAKGKEQGARGEGQRAWGEGQKAYGFLNSHFLAEFAEIAAFF